MRAMGQSGEALQYYDMAIGLSTTADPDRMYLGLRLKSATLISLGRASEAIPLLRSCLNLSTSLSTYYTLVRAHRELKDLNEREWRHLISEMIKANYQSNSEQADIYWALFESHEEINEYSLAWAYLNKAHSSSRASREAYSTKELIASESYLNSIRNLSQIISARTKQPSRLPIFIVGMPR